MATVSVQSLPSPLDMCDELPSKRRRGDDGAAVADTDSGRTSSRAEEEEGDTLHNGKQRGVPPDHSLCSATPQPVLSPKEAAAAAPHQPQVAPVAPSSLTPSRPSQSAPTTAALSPHRSLQARSTRPPRARGAVTTLYSIAQLEQLVDSSRTAPYQVVAAGAAAPVAMHPGHPLTLHAGETVMLLLHQGDTLPAGVFDYPSQSLSQMRIFSLDLASLPPGEYDTVCGDVPGRSSGLLSPPSSSSPSSAVYTPQRGSRGAEADATGAITAGHPTPFSTALDDDDEEEEALFTAAPTPKTSVPTATAIASSLSVPGLAAVPASADRAGSLPLATTLSSQLQQASDVVLHRLGQLLQVETILNPFWTGAEIDALTLTASGTQRKEDKALTLPSMVVWRASGAPREEYPPAPPQTYSSQPAPSPPVRFCDRMAAQGGPLVVKEVHNVSQVHSLSLWQPVFTIEHLVRTLLTTVKAKEAELGASGSARSRSIVYLGASWCPPCMRIVGVMPQMLTEDMPKNVLCFVKADMDLAKPVYDFFKVEVIPTFVVLDNDVLARCAPTAPVATMMETLEKAELGRLQNSQRPLVSMFFEKHCKSLAFDEDF